MTITPLMFREYLVFSYNIAVIYIYICINFQYRSPPITIQQRLCVSINRLFICLTSHYTILRIGRSNRRA